MPRSAAWRQPGTMPHHIPFAEAQASLRTRRQLIELGWHARDIARQQSVASGRLRRLQRNRYVLQELWDDLWPESRHRLEIAAACAEMRGGPGVVSHESAVVMWDAALYRHTPDAVHLTLARGGRGTSRAGLARHAARLPEGDVTEIAGILCTSLDRTVFDAARTLPIEAGLAVADDALRRVAVRSRVYDTTIAEQWREGMRERAARSAGARGVRRALEVVALADGRSESPGESVHRLRLVQVGFTHLRPQVPVRGPHGSTYFVDLEDEQAQVFFEFDGKGKYLDEALRSGRSLEQVLLAEKRREDWIRGTTQRRLVRSENAHIETRKAMSAHLRTFGIEPPRH